MNISTLPQNTARNSLLLTLLLCVTTMSLRAQNTAAEAYQQIQTATTQRGSDALATLQAPYDFCALSSCPDSVLAKLYHRLGVATFQAIIDDDLAIAYMDTARIFYESYLPEDHPLVANQYFTLGFTEYFVGYTEKANTHIDKAIDILDNSQAFPADSRDSIAIHWYKEAANIKRKLQDGATALGLSRQALELAAQNSSLIYQQAIISDQMGLEYLTLSDYQRAYLLSSQAHAIFRDLGRDYQVSQAISLNNMGLALLAQNPSSTSALNHLQGAYQIYAAVDAPASWIKGKWADNAHNLAWYHIQNSNWEQARQFIEQEGQLRRELLPNDRYPEIGNWYLLDAKLAVAREQYDTALYKVEQALNILYPSFSEPGDNALTQVIGPIQYVTEALDLRAQIMARRGNLQESIEEYQSIGDIIRAQRRVLNSNLSQYALSTTIKPAYERAIGTCLELAKNAPGYAQQAYQLAAQNKAIVFQQSIQNSRALAETGLPKRVQEEEKELRATVQNKQVALYRAYQKDQATDSLANVLFEHQQDYQTFIQQLEANYPDYHRLKYEEIRIPTLDDIQAEIDRKQLFLEYFVGQENIFLFATDRAQQKTYQLAKPAGLQDSISLFRELLSNGVEFDCEAQFIRVSHYLYQQLVAPALNDFGDNKRLLIVPDGILNLISFETLLRHPIAALNGAEGFLLERYALSYAFSGQMVIDAPNIKTNAPEQFLGLGLEYDDFTLQYLAENGFGKSKAEPEQVNPCRGADTSRHFGRLYHSDDEVAAIAQLLNGSALLNQEATKSAFISGAAQHQILHLAMHGVFDLYYPLNSSLLFNYAENEDLILRAAEIYSMQLNADMVVLSACNTAYGVLSAGEGPMSLARAFHHAGAKATVASLWSVSDYSTAKIMQAFYEELQKGLSKDEALRNAKLAYLADSNLSSPTTSTPFYWAPAIVIGDTSALTNGSISWWIWGGLAVLVLAFVLSRARTSGSSVA